MYINNFYFFSRLAVQKHHFLPTAQQDENTQSMKFLTFTAR